jgi:3-hydroxy-3-methylglutaryl CoA synthase/uncharacterized OB-fold protein
MPGVLAYGAYVPYHRLDRADIGKSLGSGGGKGARAVASYDEDATSLGVEAARIALSEPASKAAVEQLYFATATPPYLDKTNATVLHAALRLDSHVLAVDMAGSVRSGVGAFLAGAQSPAPTLVVLADVRSGLPGGADERDGGDGAAAFLVGPGSTDFPVLAEIVASASATEEFLDRWRIPGDRASRTWEERFGEEVYLPLAAAAFADAVKQADLTPDGVDHLIVAGLATRAVKAAARLTGVRPEAITDDLAASVGNTGTAHPGLLLADVLDRAQPGQAIVVLTLADGATATVLRTTEALTAHRSAKPVAAQVAAGRHGLPYATYLTWRGLLDREPPRRPDPEHPYAAPAFRRREWKFGLVASKCAVCGTRHLPPGRVCLGCHAVDEMLPEPMAEVPGTLATYTIDRLAYSLNPPLLFVAVDFDGGGRVRCELTDAAPDEAAIGLRVEMTFRKLVTAGGIHNYFWKAKPVRASHESAAGGT